MKDKEFVKLVKLIENTQPFYVETIALRVYEKYQPKLPKDSIIISRKDYERLNMKYISALEKLENKGKETAEKWYNKVKELYLENVGEQVFEHNWFGVQINKFAKQCGVETLKN